MRRLMAACVLASLIVVLAGCGSTVTPEKVQPGQQAGGQAKPAQELKIGDAVKMGDLIFTVLGVREVKAKDIIKPQEGKKWIAVELEIQNQGSKSQAISTLLMFKLVDSDGYKYSIGLVPDLKGQLDGELASGRKVRGEVGFEIPKNAKGLELIIEPNVLGFGQAIIKLGQ